MTEIRKRALMIIAAASVSALLLPAVPAQAAEGTETHESSGSFLNIGSVSKMYTVTAVMQLVDQGKVDLDTPVCEYIDDFTMADDRYRNITVRMLMNHSSGLMGSVYADSFRFLDISADYHDSFLKALSGQSLKAEPGAYNCYCNDGFTLLEILTERVSGMSFTDYVEKNICGPIDAGSTCTMFNCRDITDQVPCYTGRGIRMAPECVQLLGAGGIMSTAAEVADFGAAFFDGNDTLLSAESKGEMNKASKVNELSSDYGLGWDCVSHKDYEDAGVKLVTKGGDTYFQHAFLAVAPDEDISISVLSSGGSSLTDSELALDLMDMVLEDRGIVIEHEEEKRVTVDKVPAEFLAFEGLFNSSQQIMKVTFPEGGYMKLEALTSERDFVLQYKYTDKGDFVRMTGEIESGNAMIDTPLDTISFVTVDGKVYISDNGSVAAEKVGEVPASDSAVSAWESRNGKKFFLSGSGYSDMAYYSDPSVTLVTNSNAKGYVNGWTITDEDHAVNMTSMPGDVSRDISDIEFYTEGGKEYISLPDRGYTYICEDCIPDLTADITKVSLSGEAQWYRLDGPENGTVTLDLPEGTSAYVYDRFGDIKYSSFMSDYGNTVPLPDNGMIVFIGGAGSEVGISR